ASESCAIDILKPEWRKEVNPSQIIHVTKNSTEEINLDPNDFRDNDKNHHCVFEHIYFSRPDSSEFNESVFDVREKIGAILADEDDIKIDAVVPVPDSANFIALGYAKQSDIPFNMGLIRNHYVGRTFIKPEQTIRDESVSQKFNSLPNFFKNKRIVLIDDSIVRGTTMLKIVKLIKDAGVKEIHLRIGSPMVKHSCYYGIDTPTKDELIANRKTLDEIKKYLDVDSIKFISIASLMKTVKSPDNYCYACFNGDYPVKIEE
ncbi:MAG: phosphoribosyltransferase family protein, partial [Candidatus Cloacimonadota bacterium]|nr:phosphoribosyltransferase family protein [Candidatus Cloacimonadota bacterium]